MYKYVCMNRQPPFQNHFNFSEIGKYIFFYDLLYLPVPDYFWIHDIIIQNLETATAATGKKPITDVKSDIMDSSRWAIFA